MTGDYTVKAITRSVLQREIELEHEVQSIQTRIEDLEWQIARDTVGQNSLLVERHRALDKLRETRRELMQVRLDILEL